MPAAATAARERRIALSAGAYSGGPAATAAGPDTEENPVSKGLDKKKELKKKPAKTAKEKKAEKRDKKTAKGFAPV